ncbi:hypothetical protein QTI05_22610 [Variovorax sp. J22R193]|uniref:hypothetical protein n=1 Tax=Variovorax fucosicus TaxID=3053517 RepID=UPI002576B113|nr:hypothetical protein [Variovorax sp. J22R193]MDM0041850.1 hypothetical protein [Variovorax sp. J22R193]
MYSDPALIRKNFVKLSLSDREADLINAFCAYSGEQKATFLRDLILRKAEEVLHVGNSVAGGNGMRDANQFLSAA